MSYNLSKKKKILEEKQFKLVFNQAKKVFSDELTIFFCNNSLEYPRIGVIIPKKNIGKAVQRNSFKRVVREFFRKHQENLEGLDLVVLVNKKGELLDKKGLYQVLVRQFGEIRND